MSARRAVADTGRAARLHRAAVDEPVAMAADGVRPAWRGAPTAVHTSVEQALQAEEAVVPTGASPLVMSERPLPASQAVAPAPVRQAVEVLAAAPFEARAASGAARRVWSAAVARCASAA